MLSLEKQPLLQLVVDRDYFTGTKRQTSEENEALTCHFPWNPVALGGSITLKPVVSYKPVNRLMIHLGNSVSGILWGL